MLRSSLDYLSLLRSESLIQPLCVADDELENTRMHAALSGRHFAARKRGGSRTRYKKVSESWIKELSLHATDNRSCRVRFINLPSSCRNLIVFTREDKRRQTF